jgi:DNA invertase Pin-like site-specific DNA recombinase/transposase
MAVHIGPKKRAKSTLRYNWDDLDPRTKAVTSTLTPARSPARPKSVLENTDDSSPGAFLDVAPDANWDEVDLMIMDTAALTAPLKKRSGATLRIAVYTRFSTDQQKAASSEIQERECVRYYRANLGGVRHTHYRDDAQTGTNTDRQGLQEFLEAVAADLIDVVVIWTFDRLSRETYDGVPVIQFLEKHGVELHISRKGRRVTKREAIIDAVNAEEENALRIDRLGQGLDDLVRNGGLPWGWHYGLRPTRRSGFPEPDPDQWPIVQGITRDIVFKSSNDIAYELNAEGIRSPEGNGPWDGTAVSFIAQNIANTGRIHFRKTAMMYDPVNHKWERKTNPKHKWVKGFNADIILVTDQEFIAAVQAIQARNSRQRGITLDRSNHALAVFGNPICDCPARNETQSFLLKYVSRATQSHRYTCKNGNEKCCSDAQSFVGNDVEKAIFDAMVPRLKPRLSGFDDKLKASLIEVESLNQIRRDAEAKILAKNVAQSQRLRRQSLEDTSEEAKEDYKAITSELDAKRQESKRRLALIPTIAVEEIDFDGVREDIFSALVMLRNRIPFVPKDREEVELINKLREGVLGIRIARQGRLRGSFSISIAAQWERYVLSETQVMACNFQPEIIETECHLDPSYINVGSVNHMSELAAAGLHALSDEQWEFVKDKLPDLSITKSAGLRASDTRKIVHVVIFTARMKVPLTRPPAHFGRATEVLDGVKRFVYAGGIEVLKQTLGSNAEWSEGLDFSKFDKLPRSKHSTTQPALAASRAAKTGEYDLTDQEWGSIEHLFVEKLSKPASGRPAAIDMRTAMNGILIKIRTGCAWEKMPVNFGTGADLLNIVQRLHYHGVWHATRGILTEKFPKVVDGLPVEQPFAGWQLRRPRK